MKTRELREEEIYLIEHLLQKANISYPIEKYSCSDMNDGGQGSIRLLTEGVQIEGFRFMGARIAEQQFLDSDGVPILVSLNVDKEDYLYEIDIWKTDFSPVIQYPQV